MSTDNAIKLTTEQVVDAILCWAQGLGATHAQGIRSILQDLAAQANCQGGVQARARNAENEHLVQFILDVARALQANEAGRQ